MIVSTVKIFNMMLGLKGSQRDVVYLGWPIIAPSYMSPNGEGGSCGASDNEYSCAHHERSTSIFNPCIPGIQFHQSVPEEV